VRERFQNFSDDPAGIDPLRVDTHLELRRNEELKHFHDIVVGRELKIMNMEAKVRTEGEPSARKCSAL
jgi:hypothetical protein